MKCLPVFFPALFLCSLLALMSLSIPFLFLFPKAKAMFLTLFPTCTSLDFRYCSMLNNFQIYVSNLTSSLAPVMHFQLSLAEVHLKGKLKAFTYLFITTLFLLVASPILQSSHNFEVMFYMFSLLHAIYTSFVLYFQKVFHIFCMSTFLTRYPGWNWSLWILRLGPSLKQF